MDSPNSSQSLALLGLAAVLATSCGGDFTNRYDRSAARASASSSTAAEGSKDPISGAEDRGTGVTGSVQDEHVAADGRGSVVVEKDDPSIPVVATDTIATYLTGQRNPQVEPAGAPTRVRAGTPGMAVEMSRLWISLEVQSPISETALHKRVEPSPSPSASTNLVLFHRTLGERGKEYVGIVPSEQLDTRTPGVVRFRLMGPGVYQLAHTRLRLPDAISKVAPDGSRLVGLGSVDETILGSTDLIPKGIPSPTPSPTPSPGTER